MRSTQPSLKIAFRPASKGNCAASARVGMWRWTFHVRQRRFVGPTKIQMRRMITIISANASFSLHHSQSKPACTRRFMTGMPCIASCLMSTCDWQVGQRACMVCTDIAQRAFTTVARFVCLLPIYIYIYTTLIICNDQRQRFTVRCTTCSSCPN